MRPAAARWFVRTAMVVAVVAMNIGLGRPAGAAVDMAELQPLRADLEGVAATSASLYQQAGRLLVRLAEAELADPRIRSNAVAAIRTVTRSSSRLSERARQLSGALDPLPVGIPGTAEQLNDALSSYRAAEQDLGLHVNELQTRIAAAKSTKSAKEFAAELEAFPGSAEAYDKAAQAFDAVLGNLKDTVVGRTRAPGGRIRLSVHEFYDDSRAIEGDYGLYTHVLFASQSDRNIALLETLLNTPPADLFADQPAINVFAIPVSSRVKAKLVARTSTTAPAELASPKLYDYERAKQILGRICLGASGEPPEFCSGQWAGPFLVTYDQPLSQAAGVEPPYLLVDLSNLNKSAFGEFVRAVQEQVMLPDFSNREKIDTLRLQLLDVTLRAADWLGPITKSVSEILALVKEG